MMHNTIGNNIKISVSGESHSKEISLVVSGIEEGVSVDFGLIDKELHFRNPKTFYNTQRPEDDSYIIESGFCDSKTTGEDIVIRFPNTAVNPDAYKNNEGFLRPSHSDYSRFLKYGHISSGGGMSSGRITLPIVFAGAIAEQILAKKQVKIVSFIKSLAAISDEDILGRYSKLDETIGKHPFLPVFTDDFAEKCLMILEEAKLNGDSIGCVIETHVLNMPKAIGEPVFDSFESVIAHFLFSIPAVKGVEFGDGFELAKKHGSEVQDSFVEVDGVVETKENHNGGINGGITNGMPVIFRTAIKPTPTLMMPMTSYNLCKKEEETVEFGGNHDVFIGNRVIPVINAISALTILDFVYENER